MYATCVRERSHSLDADQIAMLTQITAHLYNQCNTVAVLPTQSTESKALYSKHASTWSLWQMGDNSMLGMQL